MIGRLKWLKEQLKSIGLEGMIVSNPSNIKYITGLDAEGVFLIASKENVFITDSRYIEEVTNTITLEQEIVAMNQKELDSYDYEQFFTRDSQVGFEEDYISYAKYQDYMQKYKVNLVETEGLIEKLRAVKDEEEIANIKKACKITDDAFKYILTYIVPGVTEKEVAFELQRYMIEQGADGLAFDLIVASGANSSKPHAVPTDKKIEDGDIVLIDMGAKYHGYCSDMTRTIFVGSCNFKKEYNYILEKQKSIVNQFKDGTNIKPVIKQIEEDYLQNNYDVMHAFGHNLGIDIHEDPVLRSKLDQHLKTNMVIAVEPGIYLAGQYGIRIEDTYLVTSNGCEQLTKSDKSIVII